MKSINQFNVVIFIILNQTFIFYKILEQYKSL
jgi:hypothetical protein